MIAVVTLTSAKWKTVKTHGKDEEGKNVSV